MRPCVYFDLDGVLIDSRLAIGTCVVLALAEYGLKPSEHAALNALVGPPLIDGFTAMLAERGHDPALAPSLVSSYRASYGTVSLELTELVPGTFVLLAGLAGPFRLAVATSKPISFAEPILERLKIRACFQGVFGPTPEIDGESKTATLGRAIETLQGDERPRSPATMIGDRHHDFTAARAHRLPSIGVTWGSGTRAELEAAGTESIVETIAELERNLARGAP